MNYNKCFKSTININSREATELKSMADSFPCNTIYIRKTTDPEHRRVSVSSIFGLMSLGIKANDELEIICLSECDIIYMDKIIDWFTEYNR